MSHRPKFRSIAAFAMTAAIIVGAASAALAVWVGLRDAAIKLNFVDSSASDSAGSWQSFSAVERLWTSLTQHTFVPPAIVSIVMLLIAYLLRKIVLSGLRD